MTQRTAPPPPASAPATPFRRRPANAIPRLRPWEERGVRAIVVVTLAYWTYYMVWRWTSTLNPDALWFSVPLALAETWGLITAFIMAHSAWRLTRRRAVDPPPGLSVDVFITCYDEPLEIIRRTAVGARAIRYPHRTWVLDDGRRDEVRQMARQLGLGYLRREDNRHAKAGNLNHALAHTRGDFVLQLDADHVPLPHILDRLLGFLADDPKLAFVQSPQDFYNLDAFTYDVNEDGQRMWEEQRLFFGVVQAGKDTHNGAFFCGSCALLRRSALEEVGGFATHSVTEDIETSLKLHAAGWRSAFYGESLAYGLAAGSAAAFHTQHLRWGQGAMQVLRRYNPLTMPGLTLAQRISYFGSLTAYGVGPQKLVYYLAPLVFFLTGVLPIRALDAEFLARFLPFLALTIAMSEAVGRGRSNLLVAERYHMVKFWTYTRAVSSLFRQRPLRFQVTPKGPGHVPFRTYAPQVVLMALSALALAWATAAAHLGWIRYPGGGWDGMAFRTNALWLAINFAFAASVVRLCLRVRQQRSDHRFRDRFPVTVRVRGQGGGLRAAMGMAEDLNPYGIAVRVSRPLAEGSEVRLVLPLATRTVEAKGTVVHVAEVKEAGGVSYRAGVRFERLPVAVRDAVELHCAHHAVPQEQAQYRIAAPLLMRTLEWMRNARRERRRAVRLPARVALVGAGGRAGRERAAVLEELSRRGARLVMAQPLPPGTEIHVRVPGTRLHRTGRVVFSRAIETPAGTRYAIGLSRAPRPRGMVFFELGFEAPRLFRRASKAAAVVALACAASGGAPASPGDGNPPYLPLPPSFSDAAGDGVQALPARTLSLAFAPPRTDARSSISPGSREMREMRLVTPRVETWDAAPRELRDVAAEGAR
jgi:cellulose synthase (UDP-forming)